MEEIKLDIEECCYLCNTQMQGQLFQYHCVEESFLICKSCFNQIEYKEISHSDIRSTPLKHFQTKQNQKVNIKFISNAHFYKLKYQECQLCYNEKICIKICKNEHYLCKQCMMDYNCLSFRTKKYPCAFKNCDQELNNFVIAHIKPQFLKFRIYQRMLCPNQQFDNTFSVSPYGKIETQINFVNEHYSGCVKCKAQIGNTCWQEFYGSYLQHLTACKTEQYQNQLLKLYIDNYHVKKCPKCGFYGGSSCRSSLPPLQQCQLCGTQFYFCCSTGIGELFTYKLWYSDTNKCQQCLEINIEEENKKKQ